MKKNITQLWALRNLMKIIFVLVTGALFGCGGSSVVLSPNYDDPEFTAGTLKRDSLKIVSVIDKRAAVSNEIGSAQVGMFNKDVPYSLDTTVSGFVNCALNTFVLRPNTSERYLPVSVSLEDLMVGEHTSMFSEEGYATCKLRFAVPQRSGPPVEIGTSTEQKSSGMDVTNSLELLVYQSLRECTRQFIEGYYDNSTDRYVQSAESAAVFVQRVDTSLIGSGAGKSVAPPGRGSLGTLAVDEPEQKFSIAEVSLSGGLCYADLFADISEYWKTGTGFGIGLGFSKPFARASRTKGTAVLAIVVRYGSSPPDEGKFLEKMEMTTGSIIQSSKSIKNLSIYIKVNGYFDIGTFFQPYFTIGLGYFHRSAAEIGAYEVTASGYRYGKIWTESVNLLGSSLGGGLSFPIQDNWSIFVETGFDGGIMFKPFGVVGSGWINGGMRFSFPSLRISD